MNRRRFTTLAGVAGALVAGSAAISSRCAAADETQQRPEQRRYDFMTYPFASADREILESRGHLPNPWDVCVVDRTTGELVYNAVTCDAVTGECLVYAVPEPGMFSGEVETIKGDFVIMLFEDYDAGVRP